MPQHVGEPVGEPIETPRNQPAQPPVSTGFTMQMDALDAKPVDSTQEFMSAYNAVRRPRPAAQPAPAPRAPPAAEAAGTGRGRLRRHPRHRRPVPRGHRGDRRTAAAPPPARRCGYPCRYADRAHQADPDCPGPAARSCTACPHRVHPEPRHGAACPGTVRAGPQRLHARPGWPAPAEPNTSAFVSDIANAINSEKRIRPSTLPQRPG